MLACHSVDKRRSLSYERYGPQVLAFRETLNALLREARDNSDEEAWARAEQALAALYRLEWALRDDGYIEIALPHCDRTTD